VSEQSAPITNDQPVIQEIVIAELHARWKLGQERYNVPGLQINNGRDMTRDALEEAQDLLIYMTGIRERDRRITQILLHLLDIHTGHSGVCGTCGVETPCHTTLDVTQMLALLANINLDKDPEDTVE
jgi:hypothetical protein